MGPRTGRTLALTLGIGGVALAAAGVGRRTLLGWGADDDERRDTLPGDNLTADADLVATRSITIRSPPDAVWPWIAQLGQGRAGFYSYDFLENLLGCDIHSADRIVPEWQQVRPGGEVRLHPTGGLTVAVAEPARALVLHAGAPIGRTPQPFEFTWAFVLRGRSDGTTRLVVRERYRYLSRWAALLVEPVAVVSFVMSRKMLRGIRARAEGGVADANPASVVPASSAGSTSGDAPGPAVGTRGPSGDVRPSNEGGPVRAAESVPSVEDVE
jgi:hypothetical protein